MQKKKNRHKIRGKIVQKLCLAFFVVLEPGPL